MGNKIKYSRNEINAKFVMQYKDIIRNLVAQELKLRYKNTFLGFFWSLLNPLLIFMVVYFVFGVFLKNGYESFAFYLLFSIMLWRYYSNGTLNGMYALTANISIIKKIYCPREVFPVSSIISSTVISFMELAVFFVIYFIAGGKLYNTLLAIPMVLFFEMLIISGTVFFLSTAYYRFRDFAHIWEVLLQALFFLCPIVYQTEIIPPKYIWLYKLNPMAVVIEIGKNAAIRGVWPSMRSVCVLASMSIVILLAGYLVFKVNRKKLF